MNPNRWKPDGDKCESHKADEQWEKAHLGEFICEECSKPLSKDDEYHVTWKTCDSYCFGKMVGVYY